MSLWVMKNRVVSKGWGLPLASPLLPHGIPHVYPGKSFMIIKNQSSDINRCSPAGLSDSLSERAECGKGRH